MKDGHINYSEYTASELREALAAIDPERFPKNHANLLEARDRLERDYASRGLSPPSRRMPLLSDTACKWIFRAGFIVLVAGGLLFAYVVQRKDVPNYQLLAAILPVCLGSLMLNVHGFIHWDVATPEARFKAIGAAMAFFGLAMGAVVWFLTAPQAMPGP